jgi:hypothetical protein
MASRNKLKAKVVSRFRQEAPEFAKYNQDFNGIRASYFARQIEEFTRDRQYGLMISVYLLLAAYEMRGEFQRLDCSNETLQELERRMLTKIGILDEKSALREVMKLHLEKVLKEKEVEDHEQEPYLDYMSGRFRQMYKYHC